MSKPNLIFLHIPKAGGSTLRQLLHKQYTADQIYKIESDINGDIQRFAELNEIQRAPLKLVTGHMAYGLHQFLPSSKYLTFMREPVDRVISEFSFISENPHHVLYDFVSKMSLTDYLKCDLSSQISNGQTRLLAGVSQGHCVGIPSNREITETDFKQALINLDQAFILPSTLTYYDETLLLWAKQFGWGMLPLYIRENITPGARSQVTEQDRQEILSINQWDTQLYSVVQAKMASIINEQGSLFSMHLKVFRQANWLFRKSVAAKSLMRAKFTTRASV